MDSIRPRELRSPSRDPAKWPAPVGHRILIPGYPHWAWDQKERALVLFGSFAVSLLVGIFSWGTAMGLAILGFAFVTHAFSAADAIRQYAFPGFGKLVPALSASAGLGALCYGPVLVTASIYAWPIALDERPREGYFVNRWAYQKEGPKPGETVWLRPTTRGARPKIARIVAGPGQRIEWAGEQFRVDDQVVEDSPFRVSGSPDELKLTIPEGRVLVTFGADPTHGQGVPGGWEIVEQSDVRGRAWARSYPIWDRRLLH